MNKTLTHGARLIDSDLIELSLLMEQFSTSYWTEESSFSIEN
jgi:hypothetical protein